VIVSHSKTLATHGISSLTHSETKNSIVQTKNHIVSHLKTLATHGISSTFGFFSGRGMFGRAIHSIPISKINSEIAIALFCAFDCCFLVPFMNLVTGIGRYFNFANAA
jgi:hypothetical protein